MAILVSNTAATGTTAVTTIYDQATPVTGSVTINTGSYDFAYYRSAIVTQIITGVGGAETLTTTLQTSSDDTNWSTISTAFTTVNAGNTGLVENRILTNIGRYLRAQIVKNADADVGTIKLQVIAKK